MNRESEHGKWTVSSSDESADEKPEGEKPPTSLPPQGGPSKEDGPHYPCSEARKAALKRKSSPLKHDDESFSGEMSPARKQKLSQDGLGWCLSSSDDEDDLKNQRGKGEAAARARDEECCASSEKTRTHQLVLSEKPAELSDKVQDTWDLLNDRNPFRFFLTKVKGIKAKYNSGALHIKGEKHQDRK